MIKRLLLIVFVFSVVTLKAQQDTSEVKKHIKKDYLITVKTSFGDMFIVLSDLTPLHKDNFIRLTRNGFYDSTTFHRVMDGFMIQGGDPNSKDNNPNNDGQGGPGYTIPAEFNPALRHKYGAVAAARMGDAVNPQKRSSGSQFYIVENAKGTPFLDRNYTVFGKVVKGHEVIDKIAEQKKNRRNRPYDDIYMDVDVKWLKKKKITKLTGFKY